MIYGPLLVVYRSVQSSCENMFVYLNGKLEKFGKVEKIKFDLPPEQLDEFSTVAVREIRINFDRNVKEFTGILSTTLIDKSPINTKQQLYYCYDETKIRIFYEKTMLPMYQDIRASQLDRTEWFLETNCPGNAETIYIVLEIN